MLLAGRKAAGESEVVILFSSDVVLSNLFNDVSRKELSSHSGVAYEFICPEFPEMRGFARSKVQGNAPD